MAKLPTYTDAQWQQAVDAVEAEYQAYLEALHENGVDFVIANARKLLIFQDLVEEWRHKLPTVISDLEDNPFALTVFNELKTRKQSTLLNRAYESMASWSNFNPEALTLWLELSEDAAQAEY